MEHQILVQSQRIMDMEHEILISSRRLKEKLSGIQINSVYDIFIGSENQQLFIENDEKHEICSMITTSVFKIEICVTDFQRLIKILKAIEEQPIVISITDAGRMGIKNISI